MTLIEQLAADLMDRRRLLGLSRTEAFQKFRVPPGFIAAIEDAQFDALPSLVYTRGFLKTYCEGLGLAPEPRIDMLEEALRQRSGFRMPFLGEAVVHRPQWADDALAWAAVAAIVVLGWVAYSVVAGPGNHSHESGVHAEVIDLRGEDPLAAP